jgi:hypothetical protein
MKIDRIVQRIEQLRAQQHHIEARERDGNGVAERTPSLPGAPAVAPQAFGLSAEMHEVLAQVVSREHDRRALRLPEPVPEGG